MTLRGWIKQFEKQLSERDLKSMAVHKATIAAQLKDAETANPIRAISNIRQRMHPNFHCCAFLIRISKLFS